MNCLPQLACLLAGLLNVRDADDTATVVHGTYDKPRHAQMTCFKKFVLTALGGPKDQREKASIRTLGRRAPTQASADQTWPKEVESILPKAVSSIVPEAQQALGRWTSPALFPTIMQEVDRGVAATAVDLICRCPRS